MYYAYYEENRLVSIGKVDKLVGNTVQYEITEAEYNALEAHIKTVASAVEAVFADTMSIEDVDESIRNEVATQVAERKAIAEEIADEISDSEALDIILGGETA